MFAELTAFENLLDAFRKASRGKRGQGNVAAFEHRLEENLVELREQLLSGTYKPGRYKSFFIHEPKRRLISAAPFRDRVVHHALCNVIEPLFERGFIHDTYANRRGKGTHRALARCQELARRYPYVLSCDVRQFFPSIDHEILLAQLRRKVAGPRVLGLIAAILASGEGVLAEQYDLRYFPGDDLFAALRPRGLPIGNLTSQFWANVYLDPIDHFVIRELRCPGYVRYVDDLLLFGNDRRELWVFHAALVERLARLRLRLHPAAHPRPVGEGVAFLGFVVDPERRRLKRRKGIHYQRKLARSVKRLRDGDETVERLEASYLGWANHCRWANTVGLRRAVADECELAEALGPERWRALEALSIAASPPASAPPRARSCPVMARRGFRLSPE